jgi:hypothetical protein
MVASAAQRLAKLPEESAARYRLLRRIEAERSASYEIRDAVGPPPTGPLTESAVRPVVTSARPSEQRRMGMARTLGFVVLAAALGFGTIRWLSRPETPGRSLLAAAVPAPPPTFAPIPPAPPVAEEPKAVAEPVVRPAVDARPSTSTKKPVRRLRRHPVAAIPSPFDHPLAPVPRPRPRPLDVENPYRP